MLLRRVLLLGLLGMLALTAGCHSMRYRHDRHGYRSDRYHDGGRHDRHDHDGGRHGGRHRR